MGRRRKPHDGKRATSGWKGHTQSDVGSSIEAVEQRSSRTEASPASRGVGDVTKNGFRRHAGRKPCGGWDSSFHQPGSGRCFRRSWPETGVRTMQLALLAIAVDGIQGGLLPFGHVTGAERRVRTHRWWASWLRKLTTARRRRRRHGFMKRG